MSTATITLADWQDEMERRGKLDCKFACPVCGNVASPNDWKTLLPDLDRPDRAVQECIGRAMPRDQTRAAFGNGPDGVKRPCDYAAFGLFDICKLHVEHDDGKLVPVFEFAEVT